MHYLLHQSISKHVKLSESDKQLISVAFKPKEIEQGNMVLSIGQICRYDYFIIKGNLRTFYIDKEEQEHTISFAGAGWWTGDLKSFTQKVPSNFGIEAVTDAVLLQISLSDLEMLYERVPLLNRYFRILLQNNLIATENRVAYLQSASAAERYAAFTKKFPDLEQTTYLKHIASYLGITNAYLSRLRSKRNISKD